MKRVLFFFPLMSLMVLLNSCHEGGILRAINPFADIGPSDKLLQRIDEALYLIEVESQGWQGVLQDLSDDLSEEAHNLIRNDVQDLMARGIQMSGSQVQCIIDKVKDMMIWGLKSLKAKILKEDLDFPSPEICSISKTIIDLNEQPETRRQLIVQGYFIDENYEDISVALWSETEGERLYSNGKLDKLNNYEFSILLAGQDDQLQNAQKILVHFRGQELISVPIVPYVEPEPTAHVYLVQLQSITWVSGSDDDDQAEFFGKMKSKKSIASVDHEHWKVNESNHLELRKGEAYPIVDPGFQWDFGENPMMDEHFIELFGQAEEYDGCIWPCQSSNDHLNDASQKIKLQEIGESLEVALVFSGSNLVFHGNFLITKQ